jgi:L-arabinose isomerase
MYHLILDIMSKDVVLVKNIDIVENPANMLTKPISTIKFKHCLDLIGSCNTWKMIGGED